LAEGAGSAAGETIRASGGIVVRRSDDKGLEVVLVHRPSYDDWTFPKGKRVGDESDQETALREVEEETGFVCRIDGAVGRVQYRDRKDRPKSVTYWLMTPLGGTFHPMSEVDEMRWLPIEKAEELLTYEHDRKLLRAATGLPRRSG
jgi:8-oxo-dGTP pyrophosphatase MutT (NUDIX family)